MALRLGCIPYLNCEPFFSALSGFPLTRLPPRMLGRAMAAGELDAGPLSLVDFLAMADDLHPLPFGIATRDHARSVLLFSHRPVGELTGALIGVTEETSTSVELLRILLALKYRVLPRGWVGADERCDARLLIGDRALRALKSGPDFAHVTDLGSEWAQWTGGPCVFARWGVRRSALEAEHAGLLRALDDALARGLASLPAIATRRRDIGLSEAEVVSYLKGFTYRFGPDEKRAIEEFIRLRRAVQRQS